MGTGNSDSIPWVKKNNRTWESAKSRIYSVLTRMRSDRARCKSQRRFSGSYFSKLIPESSESPVPIFWKAHPKTLWVSIFLSLSPEITFAIPHKAKGRFNGRVSSCSAVVFSVKVPFWFCFMRNCEGNFRSEGQKKRKSGEFVDAPFRRWGQGIWMTLEWV